MVNLKVVTSLFVILTIVFAGSTAYLYSSPVTVTQTVSAAAPTPTVKVAYNAAVGVYLTNASGWALYVRQTDVPGNTTTSCVGPCLVVWPIFYSATITVPAGLNPGAFGSFMRADGHMQSTYNGLPLYFFHTDKAGTLNGVGVGKFYAAGSTVLSTATTSAVATGTSTTTSTSKTS